MSTLGASRENHRHVLRMVARALSSPGELESMGIKPDAFVLGILVSDVAKEPHFIERFKDRYQGNRLAAFLDHSKLSLEAVDPIRREVGLSDDEWREISEVVIGHNGPSTPGSWWKENYERELKKPYETIVSLSGLFHAYLDRLDQGGLFRTQTGEMGGGLIKISYELAERARDAKGILTHIKPTLEKVHHQTDLQLKDLERNVGPKYLGKHAVPNFIRAQLDEFRKTETQLKRILPPLPGTPFPRVAVDGRAPETVVSLDQLWNRLSEKKK